MLNGEHFSLAATRAWVFAVAAATITTLCSGPATSESCRPVYRLYRTWAPSTGLPGRVHVATFDSCEQGVSDPNTGTVEFNETVCEIARNLFQSQPGVRVTFWCERWGVDE
jgi:hypothetical protein